MINPPKKRNERAKLIKQRSYEYNRIKRNVCLHVLLNRSNLCLNVLLNCAEKYCSNAVNRRTNNIDEVNFEVTRHIILACSFFRSFRKTK